MTPLVRRASTVARLAAERSIASALRRASSPAAASRAVMSLKDFTSAPMSSWLVTGRRTLRSPAATALVPATRLRIGATSRRANTSAANSAVNSGQQHRDRQRHREARLERPAQEDELAVARVGLLHGLGERPELLTHRVQGLKEQQFVGAVAAREPSTTAARTCNSSGPVGSTAT